MRFQIQIAGFLLLAASVLAAQSLGDMARQQRREHQAQQRQGNPPPHVYTNADLPKSGGISVFGPPAPAASAKAAAAPQSSADVASLLAKQADQEKIWRQRFADARRQLSLDRARLDVLQRERNFAQMQYYSDPNVALREQYNQADLKKKQQQIDLLQKQIEADQKKLSDLTDQLRREGLPPGWARE